jgi:hypothetical protein
MQLGDGDECIDAGVLSATHAEFAAEAERVVILRPVPNLQGDLPHETAVLDRALIIAPGHNDPAIPTTRDPRSVSAVAGYEQANAEIERLRAYWNHGMQPETTNP